MLVEVPVPDSFRGKSHATMLQNGKIDEEAAIVECIIGCSNPFELESRLQPRLLAVREARYKMVLDFNLSVEDLFDLQAYPGERNALPRDAERAVRGRLLDRARQHLIETSRQRDSECRLAARLRDIRFDLRLESESEAGTKAVRPVMKASA